MKLRAPSSTPCSPCEDTAPPQTRLQSAAPHSQQRSRTRPSVASPPPEQQQQHKGACGEQTETIGSFLSKMTDLRGEMLGEEAPALPAKHSTPQSINDLAAGIHREASLPSMRASTLPRCGSTGIKETQLFWLQLRASVLEAQDSCLGWSWNVVMSCFQL